MRMLAPAQKTRSLPRLEHHRLHLGVLEAHALHHVGEFDVDAEIVGIQLQLVAVEQTARLVDVHEDVGHLARIFDAPVPVARGLRLEIDASGCDLGVHGWLLRLGYGAL
jgi:hypothetical protein